jgi:tetratricopeptide (TPR) repeat protein
MAKRDAAALKRMAQANEHYQKALQLRAGMVTSRNARKVLREALAALRLNHDLAEAHLLAGESLNVMAKYHLGLPTLLRLRGRGHLRRAIRLLPGGTLLRDQARLMMGANMVAAGKLRGAIKILERAATSEDQEVRMWALTHLGEARYKQGNMDAAIAAWNRAREEIPEVLHRDEDLPALWLRMAYRKLVDRAMRKGEYHTAAEYGQRVIDLGPMFFERTDLNNLHDAYAAIGETKKASDVLVMAVESLESQHIFRGDA